MFVARWLIVRRLVSTYAQDVTVGECQLGPGDPIRVSAGLDMYHHSPLATFTFSEPRKSKGEIHQILLPARRAPLVLPRNSASDAYYSPKRRHLHLQRTPRAVLSDGPDMRRYDDHFDHHLLGTLHLRHVERRSHVACFSI